MAGGLQWTDAHHVGDWWVTVMRLAEGGRSDETEAYAVVQ